MLSGNRVLIYKESPYRPNMANTAYKESKCLKSCCLEESLLIVLWVTTQRSWEGVLQPRGHVFHAHLQPFWTARQCNEPETAQTHYYHLAWNCQCFLTDSQILLCTRIYSATWKRWSQNRSDLMKGNMAQSDIWGCSTPSMLFPALRKVWLKRRKISTRPECRLTNKIKLN